MNDLRAIFFDVGHTLIGPARPMAVVLCETLAAAGHAVSPPALAAAIHETDAGFWRNPRALSDFWHHPLPLHTMWRDYYRRMFDLLGLVDQDSLLADRMIGYYQSPPAWLPFADVHQALGTLQSRGLCLGVISDWGSSLIAILRFHGLLRYFDFVLASANIGVAKPHSDLFQLALRRAEVSPAHALMIGDSYHNDILGARSAGIPAMLIDRQQVRPPVDCPILSDLRELITLLPAS